MNLYCLRHAKAEARSPKFAQESKRPLTADGEEIAKRVAQGMVEMDLSFDLIITSPFIRALKTAEITAHVFKTDKLWTSPNLAVDGNPRKLIDELNENYGALNSILLVGHEPFLSALMSVLLSGDQGVQIELKKSGLAKLEVEDLRFGKCACLEWLLTPRQLQRYRK